MTTVAPQKAFAAQLDAARVAQRLSIRTVGRIVGVRPTTVHGWLNGTHFPAPAMQGSYLRVVEILGMLDEMPPDVREALWVSEQSRLWAG